jgi:hypothetical protein
LGFPGNDSDDDDGACPDNAEITMKMIEIMEMMAGGWDNGATATFPSQILVAGRRSILDRGRSVM